ncbi:MAG: FAD-dependent oxidoreductase [Candidatus Microthrix sp.]|nr:FAD-dependent oxidoreductase [Candidatus Microthrix sp.]
MTRRLVIVGGGIAGLAAAWEASASRGVSVSVLDNGVPASGGKAPHFAVGRVANRRGRRHVSCSCPGGVGPGR